LLRGLKRREIRETAYFVDAAAAEILPRLYRLPLQAALVFKAGRA
jgi:hypothetical protein